MDCLLGADFLQQYKAIVDCGNSVLYLTNRQVQYTIPITLGRQHSTAIINDLTMESSVQVIIPGRTVQFITGKLVKIYPVF